MNMRVTCSVIAAALVCGVIVGRSSAQSDRLEIEEDTPIALVGCVMRETDYRRQHDSGKGGFLGFGGGLGDEYVLVNASRGTTGVAGDCATATGGEAYELTGSAEDDLEPFVGQRVAISGMLKEVEIDPATGRPTGGRQVGDDLRLFEVNVESFSALAAPPPDTLARVERDQPPIGTSGLQDDQRDTAVDDGRLPRTASPLALTGLFGLLSFGGVAGLRALYRRERSQFR